MAVFIITRLEALETVTAQYLNSSGASPGHCCAGGGCESAREQKGAEELTWSQPGPYSRINPVDGLDSNQGGKHTANPPVPFCHGVYPMDQSHEIESGYIFNLEGMASRTLVRSSFGREW